MRISKLKYTVKSYFIFTRRERNGIRVLALLVLLFQITLITLYYLPEPATSSLTPEDIKIIKALMSSHSEGNFAKVNYKHLSSPSIKTDLVNIIPFWIDTMDSVQWVSVGLSPKQAAATIRWINRGKGIHSEQDFRAIPFISDELKIKLTEHVIYSSDIKEEKKIKVPASANQQVSIITKPAHVDINKADSVQLMALPLIGEGRARAIIRYRKALGGFYSFKQLHEIRQLPDSIIDLIVPKLKCDSFSILKININTLENGFYHPYLSKQLIRMIVNYRNAHGNFKSIDDLLQLPLVDGELYAKIAPYLTVE